MSPLVYSRKWKRNLPVINVYTDIMELIENSESEFAEKYKKELFGSSPLKDAPPDYWETQRVIEQLGGDYMGWNEMDLDSKAKIIAYSYLHNMVEVVNAHYDKMDEKQKAQYSG